MELNLPPIPTNICAEVKTTEKKASIFYKTPVVAIKDGQFYGYFTSCTEAVAKMKSIGIKVNKQTISKCCSGKRKMACGIQWFYEKDYEKWNVEIIEN